MRELRNILERAAILCDGGLITADHLAVTAGTGRAAVAAHAMAAAPVASAPASLPADLSSAMIEQALQNARFNKSKAAAALGLTRA